MCNPFFHCKDIVMSSCGCMYHPWCLGFLLQTSQVCGKSTCGEKFDFEWRTNVGFMLGDSIKPKLHREGAKSMITSSLIFFVLDYFFHSSIILIKIDYISTPFFLKQSRWVKHILCEIMLFNFGFLFEGFYVIFTWVFLKNYLNECKICISKLILVDNT
jgi:hypothetical protein